MWNGVKIIFISEISMSIIEKMFLNFIYLGTYIINLWNIFIFEFGWVRLGFIVIILLYF